MAYYSIFPEKDSTLYSHPDRLEMNTGNDEILELVKEKGSNNDHYYPSRILIKFKDEEIKNVFSKTNGEKTFADLQLFSTEHQNLASNIEIEAYPVSESWDEGTGKFSNLPTSSNGCAWLYRDNSIRRTNWKKIEFAEGSTGSIDSTVISPGGGTWYEKVLSPPSTIELKSSQSFSNADILDLNLDVSSAVNLINSDILENQGFIIKYTDNTETFISSSKGYLQFFSADTHTIYPPKLTFKWDDSTHENQSAAKTSGELSVSLYRNKKEYNQNDEALIRLHVRDKYPNRSFVTSSNFLDPGYFTTSSFYSIRDAHTEEEIIPFDNDYTKLSADKEGMFFKLYMNGLQPERHYRILFKHINDDGTEIFDNNYHFKVVR